MNLNMSLKRNALCLLWLGICVQAFNQSTTHLWGSVFSNGPYKKSWGLHLDAQARSAEQGASVKSWIIRPGIQRRVNDRHSLALGYAYVWTQTIAFGARSHQPEHRIWQQWLYQHPLLKSTLQHRVRLEERFIGRTHFTEGFGTVLPAAYATRLRYFNRILLPFRAVRPFDRGPFVAFQNEIFMNVTGKNNLNGHIYDQNRLYTAGGYRISRQIDLEFGYMNRQIRLRTGSTRQHIWQFATYLRPHQR